MSLINSDGTLIKVRISGIRNMGRSTQGVKVMRIIGDQKLVMASSVIDEGDEEEIEEDAEDLAEIAKDEAKKESGKEDEDDDEDDGEAETSESKDEYQDIDIEGLEGYLEDS